MVLIRDLSHWDTEPVPYGDYDGVIPRCYNGQVKDGKFDLHRSGAIIADTPWWPYSFYDFRYPAAPQVTEALSILGDEQGCLSLAFDVEEWKWWDGQQWIYVKYPGRLPLLNGMKTLHDGYKNAIGKTPQFYMNPATIHYLKPVPDWLLACPLWIANWGVYAPDYEPWQKWTFWQYEGDPDWNSFNGTDEEYWALVGGQPSPPPPPPPLPGIVRGPRQY